MFFTSIKKIIQSNDLKHIELIFLLIDLKDFEQRMGVVVVIGKKREGAKTVGWQIAVDAVRRVVPQTNAVADRE